MATGKTFADWYKEQQDIPTSSSSSSLLPMFANASSGIRQQASNLQSKASTWGEANSPQTVFGMSYSQRFKAFVMLVSLSALFFVLGFVVGLPVLALRPQKFAICFTCGSITFMMSFGMLKGPMAHFSGMFVKERLPFTLLYFGSMFFTIYCTMCVGGVVGYFMVIGSSAVQIFALLWYLITFLPGGSAGMAVFTNVIRAVCAPVLQLCKGCAGGCIKTVFKI